MISSLDLFKHEFLRGNIIDKVLYIFLVISFLIIAVFSVYLLYLFLSLLKDIVNDKICEYRTVRVEKEKVYGFEVATEYVEEKSYTMLLPVGKAMIPKRRTISEKYLTTVAYKDYCLEIDDTQLYKKVKKGKRLTIVLVTAFDRNDRVVQKYLEIEK